MSKRVKSTVLICLVLILVAGSSVLADNVAVSHDWSGTGDANGWTAEHTEAEPYKGSATITVTNTGLEEWGDFHFKITDYTGSYDISNVDFASGIVDGNNLDPAISINGTSLTIGDDFTFAINNVVVGATMDLFFYDNSVGPSDELEMIVYTDNTEDKVPFFGLCMYPTPVPEPATVALLGLGALLLRKRK